MVTSWRRPGPGGGRKRAQHGQTQIQKNTKKRHLPSLFGRRLIGVTLRSPRLTNIRPMSSQGFGAGAGGQMLGADNKQHRARTFGRDRTAARGLTARSAGFAPMRMGCGASFLGWPLVVRPLFGVNGPNS